MTSTGITEKLVNMIKLELAHLKLGVRDADRVWQYRDANFLNGSFDWLFFQYIRERKLK